MKLIFLGAPGAGKGTQAEIFSKRLGIPTISTGNILRAAIAAGTPVGKRAQEFMDKGRLVPDEVILDIVAQRLAQPDCAGGFILDGVPRTLAQAQALEARGIAPDKVVSLEIGDEAIVERMSGRRVCAKCGAPYHVTARPPKTEGVCDSCGGELVQRGDDKRETVLDRLAVYHRETEPLKKFYQERGKLQVVPGNMGTIQDTTRAICQVLGL